MLYNQTLSTSNVLHKKLVMACSAKNPSSYSGAGNQWSDMSGAGNHLTRNTTGINYLSTEGCFNFNNTSAQGQGFIAANQVVQRQGSFSISVVFRRNSTVNPFGNGEQIFANAGAADGFRCGFWSNGTIYYLISGAGGAGYQEALLGGSNLGNNTWQNVTWVFDRAAELGSYRVIAYQNGVATGSNTITAGASGNTAFTSSAAAMGYTQCCSLLRGDFAAIHAWNGALTPDEALFHYHTMKAEHGLL